MLQVIILFPKIYIVRDIIFDIMAHLFGSAYMKAFWDSKTKIALICVLCVLSFLLVGALALKSSKQTLDVSFSYPVFEDKGEKVAISLVMKANQKLDSSEIGSIMSINNAPLSAYQAKLSNETPYSLKLTFQAPKKQSELTLLLQPSKLNLKNKNIQTTINLDSKDKILGAVSYSKAKTLEIYLSQDTKLDANQALNLISIHRANTDEAITPKALIQGSKITFTGDFVAGNSYKVSFEKPYNTSIKVGFDSLEPSIQFASEGTIMPSGNELKIGILSTNIKKATLKVLKVHNNNITEMLRSSSFQDENVSRYSLRNVADEILSQEIILPESFDKTQTILDLSKILKNKQNGVYVLELITKKEDVITKADSSECDDEEDCRDYSYRAYSLNPIKLMILSDIGIVAQQDSESLYVNAFDMRTNTPIPNAKVTLISQTNQPIASGLTDTNGRIKFKDTKSWYIAVQNGQDINYLEYKTPRKLLDGLDTTGTSNKGNLKVFTYTDRGIIMPGEDIHINTIIHKNASLKSAPIKISIINPRGDTLIKNQIIKPIDFGLYSYTFQTDTSYATGSYTAMMNIGGVEYNQNFQVENIIPNKIKVDIQAPQSLTQQEGQLNFGLDVAYLTGAKADSLKYDITLSASPYNFSSKAYKDFSFSQNDSSYYFSETLEGKLNSNGIAKADFNFALNTLRSARQNLNLSIVAKVFENTGHPVLQFAKLKMFNTPNVIGFKIPSRYIDMTKPLTIPLVVLDSMTDKIVPNVKLSYKIYRNDRFWWYDYDIEEKFDAKIKSDIDTTLIKEGEITSQNTPIEINEDLSALVRDYDSVFIEVSDGVSKPRILWLVADFYGDASAKFANPSSLELMLDKPTYSVGDNALLRFKSEPGEKAIITLSYGENILKSELITTSSSLTTYTIPIIQGYSPNIHASVTLLRNDTSKIPSKRSFGLANIAVLDSDLDLQPKLQVSQKVKPQSTLRVQISNAKQTKMAYTLAIVDNGILDIINFKTPNPLDGLYKKLGYNIRNYDNYDNFIAEVLGVVNQSVLIGGDEGSISGANRNLGKKRKENLVHFVSGVTNEQGNAVVNYTLPNYVGSARVMLIGVNDASVGSAQEDVSISDFANMYTNLPEELKINDTIVLPLEAVAEADVKLKKINFQIQSTMQTKKLESKMNANKTGFMQFIELKPQALGENTIKITMKADTSKGEVLQSKEYKINISSPNARVVNEELITFEKNEKKTLESKAKYIPGSLIESLIVSPSILPKTQDKVEYLLSYIYGCIEQSSSATMPLILGYEGVRAETSEQRQAKAQKSINRIIRFQRNDGGFGYWIDSRESSAYGSDYAALFLLNAKQRGFDVPEYVLKAWEKYAKARTNTNHIDYALKTYPLFLLALNGTPNISMMNEVYQKGFKALPLREKLALGAAYKLSGLDSMAKKIYDEIPKDLENATLYNNYPLNGTYKDYYYFGSNLTNQAMSAYYLGIIDEKPNLTLLKQLTKALEQSSWLGTQDIATSLLALSALKDSTKEISFTLNSKDYTTDKPMRFALDSNAHNTLIAKDKLYASFITQGIPNENPLELAEISKKLKIETSFFTLDSKGKQIPLDPSKLSLSKSFYMEIAIINYGERGIRNLALSQIVPTGWEIENTRIKRQNEYGEDEENVDTFANNEQVDYMDIKQDRVIFFFDDWLDYGSKKSNHNTKKAYIKFNTTLKGEYILSGAYVEAM